MGNEVRRRRVQDPLGVMRPHLFLPFVFNLVPVVQHLQDRYLALCHSHPAIPIRPHLTNNTPMLPDALILHASRFPADHPELLLTLSCIAHL